MKEQAVVLFLGEMYNTESSLMNGRRIIVAHPLLPSKRPPAVLVLLHWVEVVDRVWKQVQIAQQNLCCHVNTRFKYFVVNNCVKDVCLKLQLGEGCLCLGGTRF